MGIVDPAFVQKTESDPVIGIFGIWGEVREDEQDKLFRKFENCEVG